SKAINASNGTEAKKLYEALLKQAKKRTAIADGRLDEEGRTVKNKEDEVEQLKQDEGVVMVESRAAHLAQDAPGEPASAGGSSNDKNGDTVPLTPRKRKKKPKAEDN